MVKVTMRAMVRLWITPWINSGTTVLTKLMDDQFGNYDMDEISVHVMYITYLPE